MTQQTLLSTIIATKTIYYEHDVNRWLETGWILLSIRTDSRNDSDGESSRFFALVGWSSQKGETPRNPAPKISFTTKGEIVTTEEKWNEPPY